jgi:hypothetical protein
MSLKGGNMIGRRTGGTICRRRGIRHAQVEFIFSVPTMEPVAGMLPMKKQLEMNGYVRKVGTPESWAKRTNCTMLRGALAIGAGRALLPRSER